MILWLFPLNSGLDFNRFLTLNLRQESHFRYIFALKHLIHTWNAALAPFSTSSCVLGVEPKIHDLEELKRSFLKDCQISKIDLNQSYFRLFIDRLHNWQQVIFQMWLLFRDPQFLAHYYTPPSNLWKIYLPTLNLIWVVIGPTRVLNASIIRTPLPPSSFVLYCLLL